MIEIGRAQLTLGETEGTISTLQEAAENCDLASQAFFDLQNWLEWAKAKANHAAALAAIWLQTNNAEALGRAEVAYGQSLSVLTEDQTPMEWARTIVNLAWLYKYKGQLARDPEILGCAIRLFEDAATVFGQQNACLELADAKYKMGTVLRTLGSMIQSAEYLKAAVDVYGEALEIQMEERFPRDRATTRDSRGVALRCLGVLTQDGAIIRKAIIEHTAALRWFTANRSYMHTAGAHFNLAFGYFELFRLTGVMGDLDAAEGHAAEAEAKFRDLTASAYLPGAEALLAEIRAAREG